MIFSPDLAAKVLDGSKTVTRRLCSENPRSPWWRELCALKVGRDYAVQPGRSELAIGRIKVVAVRREALASLHPDDVRREGFYSLHEFIDAWKAINGRYELLAEVWRVEFVLVQGSVR